MSPVGLTLWQHLDVIVWRVRWHHHLIQVHTDCGTIQPVKRQKLQTVAAQRGKTRRKTLFFCHVLDRNYWIKHEPFCKTSLLWFCLLYGQLFKHKLYHKVSTVSSINNNIDFIRTAPPWWPDKGQLVPRAPACRSLWCFMGMASYSDRWTATQVNPQAFGRVYCPGVVAHSALLTRPYLWLSSFLTLCSHSPHCSDREWKTRFTPYKV